MNFYTCHAGVSLSRYFPSDLIQRKDYQDKPQDEEAKHSQYPSIIFSESSQALDLLCVPLKRHTAPSNQHCAALSRPEVLPFLTVRVFHPLTDLDATEIDIFKLLALNRFTVSHDLILQLKLLYQTD